MKTKPEVFIIESLDPDDEGNGRFEGSIISQILRLHGKAPKYCYVRTRREFGKAVKRFGESGYRYLHISTHGDGEGMSTTNQDEIDFDELADVLGPHLRYRRLFLSACSMVREDLARKIIPNRGCLSVVGPIKDICLSDATVVWSSIYHLMFSQNERSMRRSILKDRLQRVCELFDVDLGYYAKSRRSTGYTKVLPTPKNGSPGSSEDANGQEKTGEVCSRRKLRCRS